ncbi:MAG: hypothetical protein CMI18_01960 [Opitutaceae bacterium]|nr:hypothetical protein [Opitutaceae bacterium]
MYGPEALKQVGKNSQEVAGASMLRILFR